MGIGCEACHGPGRQHVALMEAWEKDPASKPKYDNSSKNRQLSDILKIFSVKSSEPRRIYDTCAYCHGNKRNVVRRLQGRRPLCGLRDAIPDQRSDFPTTICRANSGLTAARTASTARRR